MEKHSHSKKGFLFWATRYELNEGSMQYFYSIDDNCNFSNLIDALRSRQWLMYVMHIICIYFVYLFMRNGSTRELLLWHDRNLFLYLSCRVLLTIKYEFLYITCWLLVLPGYLFILKVSILSVMLDFSQLTLSLSATNTSFTRHGKSHSSSQIYKKRWIQLP